ncbi:ABC transporter substrate-binding protein [Halostella litorea]|uniref:ABC transporter substrate-binding protein n=1 Tax=Halostella litorea TaxID=2528831 RepID=UPI00138746A9|nr:ABC transporter substrate-binding protein [Halostella litorea]
MTKQTRSRREYLALIGSASAVGVAGCSSSDDDGSAFDTDASTAGDTDTAATTDRAATGTDGETSTERESETTEESPADGEAVTVAHLAPTSGGIAELGQRQRRGADLAVEWVNQRDAYDFELELVGGNTEAVPDTAAAEMGRVVAEEDARFVTGGLTVPVAGVLAERAVENAVVYLSSGRGPQLFGSACNEWTFWCETTAAQLAASMGRHVATELGSDVWFHYGDFAYGRRVYEWTSEAMASAADGFTEVGQTRSGPADSDFRSVIDRIRSSDAEAVVLGLSQPTLVNFLNQAADLGLTEETAVVSPNGASRAVRNGAGDSAVGTYGGVRYLPSLATGDNRAFVDAYRTRYGGRPDTQARLGFDSVRFVANGIRAAGSTDREAVSDALEGGTFTTALGDVTFREGDRLATNPAWIGEVTAGSGTPGVERLAQVSDGRSLPPATDLDCR